MFRVGDFQIGKVRRVIDHVLNHYRIFTATIYDNFIYIIGLVIKIFEKKSKKKNLLILLWSVVNLILVRSGRGQSNF